VVFFSFLSNYEEKNYLQFLALFFCIMIKRERELKSLGCEKKAVEINHVVGSSCLFLFLFLLNQKSTNRSIFDGIFLFSFQFSLSFLFV